MKKVLIVAYQHGNEPLGKYVYRKITSTYAQHDTVSYIEGNPRAIANNSRYIQTDLNRSYGFMNAKTYEQKRAQFIYNCIQDGQFDLVIDFHTTNCKLEPLVLVHGLSTAKNNFVRRLYINNIADMQLPIVQHSLIGVCDNALSVEVENSQINDMVTSQLAQAVMDYVHQIPSKTTVKKLYTVTGLINKKDMSARELCALKNYVLSARGFYPILVGENSYKSQTNYLGFAATKLQVIEV